jgi:uncharacterized protein (DUF697 family)
MSEADDKADRVIAGMIAGAVGAAAAPVVAWPIFVTGMGVGVVGIGACYGVSLSKDEAWKLIKQFFTAAGFSYMATLVGGKLLTIFLAATGVGYGGAVALDVVTSSAIAYAVGQSAKAYFKGERRNAELGEIFRAAVRRRRSAD